MDWGTRSEEGILKAAIDIGTNTVLLLVGRVSDGRIEILEEQQRVPRLGKGVDEARNLQPESMERVIRALDEYCSLLDSKYGSVDEIRVTATSAVRDANNRMEFLRKVKSKTGIRVRVLSGFEEAHYTFLGAQGVLDKEMVNRQKVVLDIGGGSTEMASGNRMIRDRYSFDMGCVRFTERFLHDDPPGDCQVQKCQKAVADMLKEYEFNFVDDSVLVGVAGTVTSLAFMDKGCEKYDSSELNGYILSLQKIRNYIARCKEWPSRKLVDKYPAVMEGRADIFLAGLLILEGVMKKYDFTELITSTGGIRHGVLMDEG
jgi:exopolyphosphatase/guanosine-5'-triphosphate,3'-diphosphate pyrophosphatase